jgi:hypothetical protein
MPGNAPRRRTSLERIVTIRSAADVEMVIRSRQPLLDVRVVVQAPRVSRELSLRWERDLNKSFRECGCSHAAVCTALVLGGSLIWFVFHLSSWRPLLLWVLIALLLAATLGKLAGLAWARFRIARVVGQMRKFQPGIVEMPAQ